MTDLSAIESAILIVVVALAMAIWEERSRK